MSVYPGQKTTFLMKKYAEVEEARKTLQYTLCVLSRALRIFGPMSETEVFDFSFNVITKYCIRHNLKFLTVACMANDFFRDHIKQVLLGNRKDSIFCFQHSTKNVQGREETFLSAPVSREYT